MPLDANTSSPTAGLLPRSRSFIAKFTTPLGSRSKSITDFHVEPEDPWKAYGPGDIVSGSVVLTVVKPVRITHLVLCLHGHARVFKTAVVPGDGFAEGGFLGPGRGRRGEEYLGNGLVSLFEDEIVLCGEGRLKEGVYKFKFELEFPSKSLPSSIDFERGTVSYNITSTLTRPITIAPTMTCDKRLVYQDTIDVATVPPSKPRTISLEPILKRGRLKNRVVTSSLDEPKLRPSDAPVLSRTNTDRSISIRSLQDSNPPQSPAPSETSTTSIATSSSQSFRVVQNSSVAGNSIEAGEPRNSLTSISENAISTTIELLRPGALPGDIIPVKLSVKHTKAVRGIVFVTLYRSGRIDMHPPLPVGPQGTGKAPEYEDIYPKSRTGLGGLHFTSGSPSSVFRKDLSQSSAPMIISPHTLTADIKVSLRLPEDAFPTMNNVPGGMITFKYYIEVVIDLCGKLSESRFLPRLSLTTPTDKYGTPATYEPGHHVTSNWSDRIIDTDPMRRTKTVVFTLFDLIVGSKDSTRFARKWAEEEQDLDHDYTTHGTDGEHDTYESEWTQEEYDAYYGTEYPYDESWQDVSNNGVLPSEHHVPPPPQPEEHVDEKARLRRAEELLLPSQPPEDGGQAVASSSSTAADPSIGVLPESTAPYVPQEDGLYGYHGPHDGSNLIQSPHSRGTAVSARSMDTIVPANQASAEPPDLEPDSEHQTVDDKHELERQRLMAQASAPPAEEDGPAESTSSRDIGATAASAPVLNEEDGYQALNGENDDSMGENLPQYRR